MPPKQDSTLDAGIFLISIHAMQIKPSCALLASGLLALLSLPSRADQAPDAGFEALTTYSATLDGERREAADFLLTHLPDADRKSLSVELFRENLEQAYIARETYPWTKELPKEVFFNDVLPHALVNETRDPWRKQLRELFAPKVAEAEDAREAAAIVGREIAKLTGVSYNTKREKACQSPAESMRQGMASCTGLSILMADSLRSVGIPSRLAGIALWGTKEGNHTWIELKDGEGWQMAGYGSGNPKKWNKGWEIDRCAYSDPKLPIHGIFASSYRPTQIGLPMIWDWSTPKNGFSQTRIDSLYQQQRDPEGKLLKLEWVRQNTKVPGIDRTAHYIALAGGQKVPIPKGMALVSVRVFLSDSKTRVDVPIRAWVGDEMIFEGRSASQAQDLNDYIRIIHQPAEMRVEYQVPSGEWKSIDTKTAKNKETPLRIELEESEAAGLFTSDQRQTLSTWFREDQPQWPEQETWPKLTNKEDVAKARTELWSIYREAKKLSQSSKELGPLPESLDQVKARMKAGKPGLSPGLLTLKKHKMPFIALRKESTPPPKNGRALYIAMHGGGQNSKVDGPHSWAVNSREWQSQVRLSAEVYAGEGVYFVPRMADDRLGRWWHAHNQQAYDLVIEHAIREWGVDPDKVYMMGVSEGCYGTQILGPFMADRLGGANAMAGGVGKDVPAENLRNLAFRTDVGENDTTFNRVGLAREYHARMDALAKQYGGYDNDLNVQAGKGHGVDYHPGSVWMIKHQRNPHPDTVVWTSRRLGGNRRSAFYWLGLSPADHKGKIKLVAKIDRKNNLIDLSAKAAKKDDSLKGASVQIMLDDDMLDLNRQVSVRRNGKEVFKGKLERNVKNLATSLAGRSDPLMSFPAEIDIDL